MTTLQNILDDNKISMTPEEALSVLRVASGNMPQVKAGAIVVNWSIIPDVYQWVAMDNDGMWYAYAQRPRKADGDWVRAEGDDAEAYSLVVDADVDLISRRPLGV